MTLHTDGGPLHWDLEAQAELAHAFTDVGADRENRVIILTGTGDEFSGPRVDPARRRIFTARSSRLRASIRSSTTVSGWCVRCSR